MSNFLSHLILTSRGAVPTVRPRRQGIFEPPRPTPLGLVAAEVAAAPESQYGERTTFDQVQPLFVDPPPAPPQPRQTPRLEPTLERPTHNSSQVQSGAPALARHTDEAEVALPVTHLAAMPVETSATPSVHRPAVPAKQTLTQRTEPPQLAATPETADTIELQVAETILVPTLVRMRGASKPPTLAPQASDAQTVPATPPRPANATHETEVVQHTTDIPGIPAELSAAQPAPRLTATAKQTLVPRPEPSQPTATLETTGTTEPKAVETIPVPTLGLMPGPVQAHSTSNALPLNQVDGPFFNSQPPVLVDQPLPVLPIDQGTPITLGKLQAPPSVATPTSLLDAAEERAFTQGQAAPHMETRGVTSLDNTRRIQSRRELPASGQNDARGTHATVSQAAEPAPVIRVTIGRIEVRALQPTPSPTVRPATRQPDNRLSLEAYLKQSRRTP